MVGAEDKVTQLVREVENAADVGACEVAHVRALFSAIEALAADPSHQNTVAYLASLGRCIAVGIDGNLSDFRDRAVQIAASESSAG